MWRRLVGAGLLLGTLGCGDDDPQPSDGLEGPPIPATSLRASLARASDCDDLLRKVQDDAIAKAKLAAQRAKSDAVRGVIGGRGPGAALDAGSSIPTPTTGVGGVGGFDDRDEAEIGGDGNTTGGPTTASGTNNQVAEVDEADYLKVVESGKGIFVLHGSTLRKLKTWPASETALVGEALTIEGTPSEMFVTDAGKAVVFSTVYGAESGRPTPADCTGIGCGSSYYASAVKITVANVAGATPVVERELYYDANYVSARRHADGTHDVVRTVLQASSKFSGLFAPEYDAYDAWGRVYAADVIAAQLDAWLARTITDIRSTTLDDWLPGAREKKGGAFTAIAPACGDYFVPLAGVADYGLTRIVTFDVGSPSAPLGGVTIHGATSPVYASANTLVLAQPDYRWGAGFDFGVAPSQQTALHTFALSTTATDYRASGWVQGQLPLRNPQFGLDVAGDGTLRVATTGTVRDAPEAEPGTEAFWRTHTENHVLALRANGNALEVIGKTPRLGHEGESIYASRFVGDRAYVVTFRQTDPLIAIDMKNPAAPTVLGELQIPGFSEYVHPLDANHLVTVGQGERWGIQLQLFDVTDPGRIPAPKVLPLGDGSSSEVSYQHKAFTLFEGILAIPVSGYFTDANRYGGYRTGLKLARVDATAGFTDLGTIDHTRLYADNGAGVSCGRCDQFACYDYYCGYQPEVRRGVFVKGDDKTYVYSFSHAGVLVHDLASLTQPVAQVGLPAPVAYPDKGWYPGVTDGGFIGRDAGVIGLDGGMAMPVADAGVASN
ncbi:MAG: beta-propeller domain-containing protein [Polyangiales bacterium]